MLASRPSGRLPALHRLPVLVAMGAVLLAGCRDITRPKEKEPEISCAAGKVTVRGEEVPVAPGGYVTVGNKIISSTTCKPHRFVGISRPALEWTSWEYRLADDTAAAADFARIKSWKANVVRLPVSQIFWTRGNSRYDPGYPALVDRLVRQARAAGLDVILDLHTSDRGDPNYGGKVEIQQMPDAAHSVPFWKDLAARYKDDGGVIFELFNEPNEVSWDVWLNGGQIPGGPQFPGDPYGAFKKPYQAVGMQQLYDAVRATGANNLVLVGGTHWGYFLNEVPNRRVKGHNIAYATHPYDYPDKQPETWDAAFGAVASQVPVVISEFGTHDCASRYPDRVLDYADKHNLSWIAWAWWVPPPGTPEPEKVVCSFPSLISDWSGTPSRFGGVVKARLGSY